MEVVYPTHMTARLAPRRAAIRRYKAESVASHNPFSVVT
jgi:hypothetical protein